LQLSRRRELEKKVDHSLKEDLEKNLDVHRARCQEKRERERELRKQLSVIRQARARDAVVRLSSTPPSCNGDEELLVIIASQVVVASELIIHHFSHHYDDDDVSSSLLIRPTLKLERNSSKPRPNRASTTSPPNTTTRPSSSSPKPSSRSGSLPKSHSHVLPGSLPVSMRSPTSISMMPTTISTISMTPSR